MLLFFKNNASCWLVQSDLRYYRILINRLLIISLLRDGAWVIKALLMRALVIKASVIKGRDP